MPNDILLYWKERGAREFLRDLRGCRVLATYVIGSTRTSTVPGVSAAGPTPEATLYTPALDVEYLLTGRAISMDVIPVTPEGVPTPAIITRAVLKLAGFPHLIVDSGSYLEPKVPHVRLPSKVVGGLISECRALPEGYASRLLKESRLLGRTAVKGADLLVIGESLPGGTTTALGILAGLGYEAWGLVSGSGPKNPHPLKERVVREGLRKLPKELRGDPMKVVECLGDPLHVSMAGLVEGALESGTKVILAGGTQMAAVLALLKSLNVNLSGNLVVGTTRWVAEDNTSDIVKLVKLVSESTPVVAVDLNFSSSRFEGLRYYERGYVKEGVGAGGTAVAAVVSRGIKVGDIVEAVEEEYHSLVGRGDLLG